MPTSPGVVTRYTLSAMAVATDLSIVSNIIDFPLPLKLQTSLSALLMFKHFLLHDRNRRVFCEQLTLMEISGVGIVPASHSRKKH